jgi:hypothetical protein
VRRTGRAADCAAVRSNRVTAKPLVSECQVPSLPGAGACRKRVRHLRRSADRRRRYVHGGLLCPSSGAGSASRGENDRDYSGGEGGCDAAAHHLHRFGRWQSPDKPSHEGNHGAGGKRSSEGTPLRPQSPPNSRSGQLERELRRLATGEPRLPALLVGRQPGPLALGALKTHGYALCAHEPSLDRAQTPRFRVCTGVCTRRTFPTPPARLTCVTMRERRRQAV